MATTKEIKDRIGSVKNTQKITNAMYLISSTKMRKAKADLDKTRPYFHLIEEEIKRIFQNVGDVNSHYFYPETGRKEGEKYAYLIITADKGLAGAYNYNILHEAEMALQKHKNVELFVVGEYGRHYFQKHNIPITQSFLYTAQNPTFNRAREITARLLEEYNERRVDEIRVIYSDMENELVSAVHTEQLLPFKRKQFVEDDDEFMLSRTNLQRKDAGDYEFYPSVNDVLHHLIPSYVAGFVYGALVDSFSAEQNARMNAMSSANKNAEELLSELSAQYNRVRQAAITQEITEVAAGAKAEKKKKLREAAGLE